MRCALFAILITVLLSACVQKDPPDLTGLWTLAGEERQVTLELREEGDFIRQAKVGSLDTVAIGRYDVDNTHITFHEFAEQIGGIEIDSSDGASKIQTPYEIRGQSLVLYPGRETEERYVLVR